MSQCIRSKDACKEIELILKGSLVCFAIGQMSQCIRWWIEKLGIVLDKNYNGAAEGCPKWQCHTSRMVEMVLAWIFYGGLIAVCSDR